MKKTVLQYLIACYLFFFVTVLGLVGLGFLVVGLYLYLTEFMVDWGAALGAGLAVLVLALIFLVLAWLAAKGPSKPSPEEEPSAHQGGEAVETLVRLLEKSCISIKEASLIALVGGTLLGASPELRRKLFGGGGEK